MPMTIFEVVKANVTPRMATERYGLHVSRSGMVYRQLSEEKAALEKKLASASGESIRKKLEINQKLRELEELRHTVEILPPEILQAAKRHGPYKGQER